MPIATAVILLPAAGPSLLGDYLTSLADRSADPPDLIAMPVSAEPDADVLAELDSVLPAPAAEVIARLGLSGRAGEIAETIARAGPHTLRLAFVGVGDSSPAALRRAGGNSAGVWPTASPRPWPRSRARPAAGRCRRSPKGSCSGPTGSP